jgi:hypothetical protein
MIDAEAFSALRMETFFPERRFRGRKVYLFDAEYWDGLWHEDRAPGASFLFPEADRKKLGVLTLLHPFEDSSAPRSVLAPDPADMRANANKVLAALELPFRFGDGQAAVKRLAEGKKVTAKHIRESKATQLLFPCGKPAVFRVLVSFGHKEGASQLEIARLDLVRANKKYYGGARE